MKVQNKYNNMVVTWNWKGLGLWLEKKKILDSEVESSIKWEVWTP